MGLLASKIQCIDIGPLLACCIFNQIFLYHVTLLMLKVRFFYYVLIIMFRPLPPLKSI
ncbi:hypothetical protein HanRHA438_Chr11g0485051 [Helianthus annuus]|nr:hypothetical protein HanIR_Chr11g0507921 [Helianthus annuus]KAJ0869061.1 hypothetical protein HanRHA438_Chr11g0485051 [Helianthus annuus]